MNKLHCFISLIFQPLSWNMLDLEMLAAFPKSQSQGKDGHSLKYSYTDYNFSNASCANII